ncbi:MAG: diacylglycerol kinase family lipid kinase [Dehalococcoidia bacterium]|nr:MAG: diacylglycerol kinase family lipid kinase [Dehalococcoidia bacterium]
MLDKLRSKIIVNPAAGSGTTTRRWPHIKRQLDGLGIPYDFIFTEKPGHAIQLAKEAAEQNYRNVVAVGGDGTINEVVNGLLTSAPTIHLDESLTPIDLGVINTGTGSDFVRSLGIPRNPDRACHHLLSRQRLKVDVGLIEWNDNGEEKRRFFVNAAGVGFDAEAAEAKKRISKILHGPISYLLSVGSTLFGYRNRPVAIKCDEASEKIHRVLSVIIANGKYFGGGMKVAPDAELGDQLFDVITIGDIGKVELLQAFPKVYRGTHITHSKVSIERAATITLSSTERLLLQADGEIIGEGAFRLSLLPGALNVII